MIMPRNHSFINSKKLPESKMTEINSVKIPAMPGSSYHAIICTLAEYKDKVVPWTKIFDRVEKYIRQYGGVESWEKFFKKVDVKSYQKRVELNVYALTRSGANCYGYRLHERGMAIYVFKDGVMLVTGGKLTKSGSKYNVIFPDGRKLQQKTKGRNKLLTSSEYNRFVELGHITPSCEIVDSKAIARHRKGIENGLQMETLLDLEDKTIETEFYLEVCVTVSEDCDQNTAYRFESIGFMVDNTMDDEIFGKIPEENLSILVEDEDVLDVEVLSSR